MEANRLEEAASAVIAETADELKRHFGGDINENMTLLLNEMLNGAFATMRVLSGKPWISFLIASGAFGVALVPTILKNITTKKQKEKAEQNGIN